jgi:uncharacterized membrane protein
MKKNLISFVFKTFLVFAFIFVSGTTSGQSNKKDRRLIEDSQDAIKDLEDALAVGPTATMYFHLAQAYQVPSAPIF